MTASEKAKKRFLDKVKITSLYYCWEWTAGRHSRDYGVFKFQKQMWLAHRMAWFLTYGEIPEGLCVLHHCDNPPCVNPLHLFLGVAADNVNDMSQKGRHRNQKKTHCPQGHPYIGDNIYKAPNRKNYRGCRACIKERNREYREQNKEKIIKYQYEHRRRKNNK